MMRIFLFGAGYSARAFARIMAGTTDFIGGTTRDSDKFAALKQDGITPFLFQGTHASQEIVSALEEVTHIVISTSPGQTGDPVYAQFGETIRSAMPKLQWIGYLSTVGVYGDYGGAWVDETTPCHPVSARSVERVDAEQDWQKLADARKVPLAIDQHFLDGLEHVAVLVLLHDDARTRDAKLKTFAAHVLDENGELQFAAARDEE